MTFTSPETSPESFRKAMSTWTTGISIITAPTPKNGEFPIGIVCNSIASISLAKQLFLWTVDHASGSFKYWIEADDWVVHFLAADQADLVKRFAMKGVANKFEGLQYSLSKEGAPLLGGVVTRLYCTTENKFETFDHTIIVGKVNKIESSDRTPIIFLHSNLAAAPTKNS